MKGKGKPQNDGGIWPYLCFFWFLSAAVWGFVSLLVSVLLYLPVYLPVRLYVLMCLAMCLPTSIGVCIHACSCGYDRVWWYAGFFSSLRIVSVPFLP